MGRKVVQDDIDSFFDRVVRPHTFESSKYVLPSLSWAEVSPELVLFDVKGGQPLTLAVHVTSASPHEVTLVQDTLKERILRSKPSRLIGDLAYDSDKLDAQLAKQKIDMIAPHRSNRIKPPSQDGRPLRRYRRRWKIERLFAWLQNFRRILVRHDRYLENFLSFIHLGCILILLRGHF